jgi:sucrose phosphorylase
LCQFIYGKDLGASTTQRVLNLIARYGQIAPHGRTDLTQQDSVLITYGDQVRAPDQAPLHTLADFANTHVQGVVSGIHLLPFYPYTSDDGFSVVDYRAINPDLGSWDDVARVGQRFRLMFDAVINHISAKSTWFQGFLQDDPVYKNYFVTVDGDPDLSQVIRPRALPLLTRFNTPSGEKNVWTTFSVDQIDLNYGNPDVLIEILDVLLYYAAQGADFIRLDAIAFMWKEIGTTCLHMPQTHAIIQMCRAVLESAAPHVRLITETNVPHVDNIAYFGDGTNEAQLVYNFALPPLTLHTLHTGDARVLSQWAATLALPSNQTTFFNFLASHDGVGLNPARGIMSNAEIDAMIARVQANGGLISYKHMPDGSRAPYEMNVNYFDALAPTPESGEKAVERFIAAHAIMFSLVGVPGIYFHSLFGSCGWPEGVMQLGHNRAINRQKFQRADLEAELANSGSQRRHIFGQLAHLLRARSSHAAFHPFGTQKILDSGPAIFAVLRESPNGLARAVCLINCSNQEQLVSLPWRNLLGTNNAVRDLVSGARLNVHGPSLAMAPYAVRWLTV